MKTTLAGWLDVNAKNPDLYGEAILLRDDDGMGFALGLKSFTQKFVQVTIEVVEPQPERGM